MLHLANQIAETAAFVRNQGQRDVVLQIRSVWVRPGDWLVADADGIVLLPQPA